MDELKHLLEDPELKGFHQDRESLPKSVTVYEGYQIFEITIVRDAQHPQDMIFVENPRANSTPPKIEVLQRHLRDFETRRSKAFQRVPANGCRANLTASDTLQ